MINDNKLKRVDASYVSIDGEDLTSVLSLSKSGIGVSGISPEGGSAGQAIVVNDAGSAMEFGTVSSAGGGGGGGGYTGFHDYGGIPDMAGNFTGNFSHSFSSADVAYDISQFTAVGMDTGNSLLLKITCPTGNQVTFNPAISFIGEKPDIFPSGKTGMLVLTCFGTGYDSIIAGYAEQD